MLEEKGEILYADSTLPEKTRKVGKFAGTLTVNGDISDKADEIKKIGNMSLQITVADKISNLFLYGTTSVTEKEFFGHINSVTDNGIISSDLSFESEDKNIKFVKEGNLEGSICSVTLQGICFLNSRKIARLLEQEFGATTIIVRETQKSLGGEEPQKIIHMIVPK